MIINFMNKTLLKFNFIGVCYISIKNTPQKINIS
jgi:hypothetical protein